MLNRQSRPQPMGGRRQEFPSLRSVGHLGDAHLARLMLGTALNRTAGRGRAPQAAGSAPPRSEAERLFTGAGGRRPVDPSAFDGLIREASRQHQVPEDLIRAVIKAESNFNPQATSHAGAMGLMQLMPGTARDLGVTRPYDPRQNIDGGTRYLREMLDRYNGSVPMALAAYNWGPGNLERGRSLPAETRNYLQTISRLYGGGRQAPKAPAPPPEPATISLPGTTRS